MLKNLSRMMGISREPQLSLDPVSLNDPVALQTAWTPLKQGGANFRTRRLVQIDSGRYEIRTTFGALVFAMVFALMGLAAVGFALYGWLFQPDGMEGFAMLMPFSIGALFTGIGGYMLYQFLLPIVFDLRNGWLFRGRRNPQEVANPHQLNGFVELDTVHALQLVSELCRSKNSSYYSHELNLVLNDGSRINIFDHGSLKHARADGETLARLLDCPLWDAVRG